jgi:hypothetical protein
MYNEAKLKQEFWTNFGQYMLPVISAEGEKPGWLNYKTGIRHLFFKMDAGRNFASIGIHIRNPDEFVRNDQFEKLLQLKNVLEDELGEEWIWEERAIDEHGAPYARVFTSLENVNIFERKDWPQVISFFKQRIIDLDRFWSMVKEGFV